MDHIENDEQFQGLSVNKGTSEQPTINPYLNSFKKFKRKTYSVSEYVDLYEKEIEKVLKLLRYENTGE